MDPLGTQKGDEPSNYRELVIGIQVESHVFFQ